MKRLDRLVWLRSTRVVYVDARVANHAFSVDDVAGGQRQRPAVVAVGGLEIDPKPSVGFTQIVWKLKAQLVLLGNPIPLVVEDLEAEPILLDEILTEARQLRRDGEQRCSGVDDTVSRFVQSIQLRFAVGSPMSAEERNDERTGFECCEQFDRYRLAVG